MKSEILIYIIISGIIALLLALFQYWKKSKSFSKQIVVFIFLRFIVFFGIFLLLINPKFNQEKLSLEKPTLVIAVDNSESIKYLEQDVNAQKTLEGLLSNKELNKRFNIDNYRFGKNLNSLDSLSFKAPQTNISELLKQVKSIYSNQTAPITLITDGNQTYGTDYSYEANKFKQPIYPIILGDSIVHEDLSIKQLNVNRYVYLKNKFPVEIIVNYNGQSSINTELKIQSGKAIVYKKALQFNASKKSEVITVLLDANSVGVKTFNAEVTALANERNTVNNSKSFGVEVIDQKTNIALVSENLHPDLGALKKAIERNQQRKVTILSPRDYSLKADDFQLAILYQPNSSFRKALKQIKDKKKNTFIINGPNTDWSLLNASQNYFKQSITNQIEDYQANFNSNFGVFIIDDLDFNGFPPLKSEFGDLEFTVPHEVLLYKSVNGISTKSPLLSTFEIDGTKHAVLNGSGIWKWRAQAYLNSESFEKFDEFINKFVQYLSSNKRRRRINIDYKSFYNGNDDIVIRAQYFNKNYEFDNKAALIATLKNKSDNTFTERPMLLNQGNYILDLNGLSAGSYDFTIKHKDEAVKASGSFQVLDYNVEQQFLNADIDKLRNIASQSKGKSYFSNEIEAFISELLNDDRYETIQKSTKNSVPLIDWKYLLGIISLSLFIEWFLRKYKGLI